MGAHINLIFVIVIVIVTSKTVTVLEVQLAEEDHGSLHCGSTA